GLLAGLSDDDAPGITTYSILGADYGYRLLWVLLLSTVALVLFHEIGARLGVVTGQGLAGLIRERYGVRWAAISLLALLIANVGTTCAEFAGVAAAMELAGVSRVVSVPVAALAVSLLVLRGSFRRIERLLLALSTVFVAYVASGLLAGPDWSATARGLVVPGIPASRAALLAATATVGTTLAPWGLAFIQSYAVDKRLKPEDLRYERIDVITGADRVAAAAVDGVRAPHRARRRGDGRVRQRPRRVAGRGGRDRADRALRCLAGRPLRDLAQLGQPAVLHPLGDSLLDPLGNRV